MKQRLVGAFVLTTLAIIILPILLDGSAEKRERMVAHIPEAPDIKMTRISVKDLKLKMERMEQASAIQLPSEQVDEDTYEGETGFTLDKNDLPVSWSLQLGSFETQENATRLRAKLREAEYHAYILYSRTGEGETWRVLVGPMLKKSGLKDIAAKIKGAYSLEGRVVRYRIEDDAGQIGG
ncbi:MAG: SPOR domain-containing protein [Pseudomonadales bacterium]